MAGKTLTRADLSEAVHRQIGLSRSESADLVKSMLDMMSDHLVEGETVKLFVIRHLHGEKQERPRRRNPKTGEEVPITPRRVLVFRPSQVMKNVINGLERGSDED